jgi:hypothetical protein
LSTVSAKYVDIIDSEVGLSRKGRGGEGHIGEKEGGGGVCVRERKNGERERERTREMEREVALFQHVFVSRQTHF